MEESLFGVKRCQTGFFLYYMGHFLGGSICPPHEVSAIAGQEIHEIMTGNGWPGYMAVIRSVETKRKENPQCSFF